MDVSELQAVARQTGLSVSLTFDADVDTPDSERWLATIGLDAMGCGASPYLALSAALTDLEREILASQESQRIAVAS